MSNKLRECYQRKSFQPLKIVYFTRYSPISASCVWEKSLSSFIAFEVENHCAFRSKNIPYLLSVSLFFFLSLFRFFFFSFFFFFFFFFFFYFFSFFFFSLFFLFFLLLFFSLSHEVGFKRFHPFFRSFMSKINSETFFPVGLARWLV